MQRQRILFALALLVASVAICISAHGCGSISTPRASRPETLGEGVFTITSDRSYSAGGVLPNGSADQDMFEITIGLNVAGGDAVTVETPRGAGRLLDSLRRARTELKPLVDAAGPGPAELPIRPGVV